MDRMFDYKNEYLIWLLIPFVYLLSVIFGIARDSIAKGIKKNIKHHTLLYDTNLFGISPAATKEKLDMVVSTLAAAIMILSTLVIVYIIFPEAAMVCLSCVFLILILLYIGKTSGFLERLNNRKKRIYLVKATVFFVYIGGLALFSIIFLPNLDKSLLFGYKLFVVSFSLRFQISSMERFSAGLARFTI